MTSARQVARSLQYRWKLLLCSLVGSTAAWLFLLHLSFPGAAGAAASPPVNMPAGGKLIPAVVEQAAAQTSLSSDAAAMLAAMRSAAGRLQAPPQAAPTDRLRSAAERTGNESALAAATQQQRAVDEQLRVLSIPQSAIPGSKVVFRDNPEYAARSAQVVMQRAHLAALQVRYTDLHPDVVAAREQVAVAERHLAAVPRTLLETVSVAAPNDAVAEAERQQKRQALEQQRASLESEIAGLRLDLTRSTSLRQRPAPQPVFRPFAATPAKTATDTAPAAALPKGAESIRSPQTAPEVEGGMTPLTWWLGSPLLAWSVLLGLASALAIVGTAEVFDRTIKGPLSLLQTLPDSALYLGSIERMRP